MLFRFLVLTLSLLLAAPAAAEPPSEPIAAKGKKNKKKAAKAQAPAPTPTPAPAWRWNWGPSGEVGVREVVTKNGATLPSSYRLVWEPLEGGGTAVRYVGLDVDWANAGELWKAKKELIALMGDIEPMILLDAEGYATGTNDLGPMIDAIVAGIDEVDADKKAGLVRAMRSPMMRATLEAAVLEEWALWVGAWGEFDMTAGEVFEGEMEQPTPMGTTMVSDVTLAHHGPVEGAPGIVHVSFRTVPRPDAAKAAMMGFLQQMAATMGESPEEAQEFFGKTAVSIVQVLEAHLDPATLKPIWASTKKDVTIALPGEGVEPQTQSESKVYTFTW